MQGHTPIVGPVRSRGSSRLRYEGGPRSALWKVFRRHGVDVYLSGEAHDVTAIARDGILQLTHGGAFQFGLTNYALLDFYADRLEVTLNDYRLRLRGRQGRDPAVGDGPGGHEEDRAPHADARHDRHPAARH